MASQIRASRKLPLSSDIPLVFESSMCRWSQLKPARSHIPFGFLCCTTISFYTSPKFKPTNAMTTMCRNKVYSRNEIEGLIAAGSIIVISRGRVLQLDAWLDHHPGGKLAIQHMVGRDATDEISM